MKKVIGITVISCMVGLLGVTVHAEESKDTKIINDSSANKYVYAVEKGLPAEVGKDFTRENYEGMKFPTLSGMSSKGDIAAIVMPNEFGSVINISLEENIVEIRCGIEAVEEKSLESYIEQIIKYYGGKAEKVVYGSQYVIKINK